MCYPVLEEIRAAARDEPLQDEEDITSDGELEFHGSSGEEGMEEEDQEEISFQPEDHELEDYNAFETSLKTHAWSQAERMSSFHEKLFYGQHDAETMASAGWILYASYEQSKHSKVVCQYCGLWVAWQENIETHPASFHAEESPECDFFDNLE
ncbi:hypothetical protein HDE_06229 [Halotydeus destructor]|nr:hypothetical protein HDE_06229 [Halotydeus destructor]